MQVTEINADGLKRDFKVVVPAGQLETRMQAKLAEIARTAALPGFRPGKVPPGILRKKYGPAIMGEVLETAVNEGTGKAITDGGLRPAMAPKVEIISFAEGADLEFSVAVEVLPEIKIMDFSSVALVRDKAQVPDSEVDDALANIASRNESSEPVKRASKDGDVVVIDFVGKKDGVAFPGGTAQGYSLKLGSNTFIPGFEAQLVGKKAGAEAVVEVTFPEGYGNEDLAGKPATFDVTVKEVRAPKAAEIDDELAKSVGLESLDALKTAIRDEIARSLDGISRMRLKRALLDVLAANHDFPVPPTMFQQEFDHIWKQVEEDKAAGRLDASDAGKSDDELKAEYQALAERRVRLGLLLADVGRVNNITVTQEDLNRGIMMEARNYPGQEHMVLQYYQKNQEALENLRAPLYEEKVIDFIIELAKITDKDVSVEELRRDPDLAVSAEASDEAPAKPKKKAAAKKKTAEE
ncbi:trigger factor [Paramagnetospirillum marisnigri]|uniref:Trigger factor n=1 Tax=Paramagnetospirillum marisnigri TaxID=1285242 RepID=A0A178MZM4_9PROT|nr:trigger factor [Paramagnetospirillum marisnigri]OAN56013.1 trigger factor [Paramagnetospirillum marisnigri]